MNTSASALLREAMSQHQAGRLPQAAARYAQVRQLMPSSYEAHFLAGQVALLQSQHTLALSLFARAVEINPRSAEAAIALGITRLATGDASGAEAPLRSASRLQPNSPNVWEKLGLILKMRGRYDEAIACQEKAVKLAPTNAAYWHSLGSTCSFCNLSDRALQCEDKAISLDPKLAQAHLGRAAALHKLHRIPEAVAAFERAAALNPADPVARSYRLLDLNYLSGFSREAVWAEHQAYGRLVHVESPRRFEAGKQTRQRLRIGLLSPDLRDHPVACFLEPLLRHADRSAFEIVLYHDHPSVDSTSERLSGLADHWRNLSGQIDEVAEKAILADSPDVMLDLAGHTGLNRLALFARRLAPVQASYLGYPNTTGLDAMDYRLVDGVTDPEPEAQRFHSERLLRFSSCAWAFDPPADAPQPGPAPVLSQGHVTFGAFNNFAKVGDDLLRCWAELLKRVPDSRLLLKAPGLSSAGVAADVERRLAQAGLPRDRVDLLERTASRLDHLSLYNRVDVALDTWPYNGTTTTCEALWMGVPVVALAGDRHASRVGMSLLRAIGHDDWVARDAAHYVELAAALARAPRPDVRQAMLGSALLDHRGQSERFFSALKQCWEEKKGSPC